MTLALSVSFSSTFSKSVAPSVPPVLVPSPLVPTASTLVLAPASLPAAPVFEILHHLSFPASLTTLHPIMVTMLPLCLLFYLKDLLSFPLPLSLPVPLLLKFCQRSGPQSPLTSVFQWTTQMTLMKSSSSSNSPVKPSAICHLPSAIRPSRLSRMSARIYTRLVTFQLKKCEFLTDCIEYFCHNILPLGNCPVPDQN